MISTRELNKYRSVDNTITMHTLTTTSCGGHRYVRHVTSKPARYWCVGVEYHRLPAVVVGGIRFILVCNFI